MPSAAPNIFIDFLQALRVPHTGPYSTRRFRSMPFRSLFGFSKLLAEYGVESSAYILGDKAELTSITPPFLARTRPGNFVIVRSITPDAVGYQTEGEIFTIPLADFTALADGMVFLAFPTPGAAEPGYAAHRRMEILSRAKKWILFAILIAMGATLFIVNGLWQSWAAVAVLILDLVGLAMSVMLVLKSQGVHTRAADRVCGVLQQGGCDSVLSTRASTFFGLFGWSEVGLAYFSVSLVAILAFPAAWPALALCNLCCLPFSFWSIWYQKFRARAWCTLCVSVQCILWLIFFCNLAAGLISTSVLLPLGLPFFLLVAAYAAALLAINALSPHIRFNTADGDTGDTASGADPVSTTNPDSTSTPHP